MKIEMSSPTASLSPQGTVFLKRTTAGSLKKLPSRQEY
jgi:hypothetical protein